MVVSFTCMMVICITLVIKKDNILHLTQVYFGFQWGVSNQRTGLNTEWNSGMENHECTQLQLTFATGAIHQG